MLALRSSPSSATLSADAAAAVAAAFGSSDAVPRARRASAPPRPRAAITRALLLAVLGVLFAPAAPIAWMFAAEQLALIARGACRATGRRALVLAHGVAIVMTMVAVAATAFGVTVLLVR